MAIAGTIVCPHCSHNWTSEEMYLWDGCDLFALAPEEGREAVCCPSCEKEFWVQGSYTPEYTTAFAEEEL